MIGSTSAKVAHFAEIPVLILREGELKFVSGSRDIHGNVKTFLPLPVLLACERIHLVEYVSGNQ
jgi:hypothetical protein